MTVNPVESIGGLTTTGNVVKADLVAWAKARVPQVMADATELRNTVLAGQLVVFVKSLSATFIQDATDTTTADDGISCIISLDGKRFKIISDKAAWTSYTPTITVDSGTLTTASASGRYKVIGKTVFFTLTIAITTNGTAGTQINATLPFTSNNRFAIMGRDFGLGPALFGNAGISGTTVGILKLDGTYPGGNGSILVVSGTFEST